MEIKKNLSAAEFESYTDRIDDVQKDSSIEKKLKKDAIVRGADFSYRSTFDGNVKLMKEEYKGKLDEVRLSENPTCQSCNCCKNSPISCFFRFNSLFYNLNILI